MADVTCHTNMTIECVLLQVSFLVVRFRVIHPMVPYSSRGCHPTDNSSDTTNVMSCFYEVDLLLPTRDVCVDVSVNASGQ